MNEIILVGPISSLNDFKTHYIRNKEIYGDLQILRLKDKKVIEYLNESEVLYNGGE